MFKSQCCYGEKCFCGRDADHKVEESIMYDDPNPARHPMTTYICEKHYSQIMGPHKPGHISEWGFVYLGVIGSIVLWLMMGLGRHL